MSALRWLTVFRTARSPTGLGADFSAERATALRAYATAQHHQRQQRSQPQPKTAASKTPPTTTFRATSAEEAREASRSRKYTSGYRSKKKPANAKPSAPAAGLASGLTTRSPFSTGILRAGSRSADQCLGCGATLQSLDSKALGYVPVERYQRSLEARAGAANANGGSRADFDAVRLDTSSATLPLVELGPLPSQRPGSVSTTSNGPFQFDMVESLRKTSRSLPFLAPGSMHEIDPATLSPEELAGALSMGDLRAFDRHIRKGDTSRPVCQRCFFLRHYGRVTPVSLKAEDYRQILQQIRERQALLVLVVDLFDFPGSLVRDLPDVVGWDQVILAANKSDILPRDACRNRLKRWITNESKRTIGSRIIDTHLVSASSGEGVQELLDSINRLRGSRPVYTIGKANVGKSHLVNRLIEFSLMQSQQPDLAPGADGESGTGSKALSNNARRRAIRRLKLTTTSTVSGTTLNLVRFELPGAHGGPAGVLIDTPGLLPETHTLADYLTRQEADALIPLRLSSTESNSARVPSPLAGSRYERTRRTEIGLRPRIFELAPGRSLFLGGLGRLDFVDCTSGIERIFCIVYTSPDVSMATTKTINADAFYNRHVATGLLTPPFTKPSHVKAALRAGSALADDPNPKEDGSDDAAILTASGIGAVQAALDTRDPGELSLEEELARARAALELKPKSQKLQAKVRKAERALSAVQVNRRLLTSDLPPLISYPVQLQQPLPPHQRERLLDELNAATRAPAAFSPSHVPVFIPREHLRGASPESGDPAAHPAPLDMAWLESVRQEGDNLPPAHDGQLVHRALVRDDGEDDASDQGYASSDFGSDADMDFEDYPSDEEDSDHATGQDNHPDGDDDDDDDDESSQLQVPRKRRPHFTSNGGYVPDRTIADIVLPGVGFVSVGFTCAVPRDATDIHAIRDALNPTVSLAVHYPDLSRAPALLEFERDGQDSDSVLHMKTPLELAGAVLPTTSASSRALLVDDPTALTNGQTSPSSSAPPIIVRDPMLPFEMRRMGRRIGGQHSEHYVKLRRHKVHSGGGGKAANPRHQDTHKWR
ncbi:hypothetical protein H696_00286 [Fonticula alba]|uniref:Uncharacterized protein n=1 Tax=Fonticula alba TaxID=691883 RepID=A0A058ZGT9_FONAL|nr:hypothetical protein H696_00286 [Fonticula alba]KCV72707.1 hypothetical protein H696_00286 [Fonticula alba]|eukprot:XP_009492408.1 hypothetical protein H696_00286 [Fonticula alba]